MSDRNCLWTLLVAITAHKAVDLLRREHRRKRGGTPPGAGGPNAVETDVAQVVGREPTPEFAAQVAEECRRLLGRLGDGGLQSVALWRMEGYTIEEIAATSSRPTCWSLPVRQAQQGGA